jgi:hypothetical protein
MPTSAGIIDVGAAPARYDGNAQASTWAIQGNPRRRQSVTFTPQNQLGQATYGLVNPKPGNPAAYTFAPAAGHRYAEDNLRYDPNGNTTQLRRTDGVGLSSLGAF